MKLLSFDLETWGREPWFALQPCRVREGRAGVTSYAVASFGPDKVPRRTSVPRPSVEDLRGLLRHAAKGGFTIATWHGPYDVSILLALGLKEEVYACKWLDGMLLRHHVKNIPTAMGRPALSLKDAVREEYPEWGGYETDIDHAYDWEHDPDGKMPELLQYNGLDALFTLTLTQKYWDALSPEQQRCALIEASCIPMVAETRLEGIAINTEAARELRVKLLDQLKLAFVSLKVLHGKDITTKVLSSPKQLADLLFQKWGLPVCDLTDGGDPSTNKKVLAELAVDDHRAKKVHLFREAKNNIAKFCDGATKSAIYNEDGYSRPQFNIFGTYTGRGTYSSKMGRGKAEVPTGCALHQWKRGAEYRRLIAAPPGYDLLEWDFAGQEFRWMAVESADPTMLDLCEPGEDAHSFMGGRISGVEYREMIRLVGLDDKDAGHKRQLGKVANLSLQYRTSPPTLVTVAKVQYELPLTLIEARAVHATYLATYPGVPRYWARQKQRAKNNGYVWTLAGRRVATPIEMFSKPDERWKVESTAINFPIQGIGGDQKYLAFLLLRDYLPSVDGRLYFELHDGLFAIVPKAKSMKASEHVTKMLSNMPYEKAWGVKLPIQFPVDPKIGETWGDLKKVKF